MLPAAAGLCATSGLSTTQALELLVKSVGLVHVPCEVVASSLEQLAGDLQVRGVGHGVWCGGSVATAATWAGGCLPTESLVALCQAITPVA